MCGATGPDASDLLKVSGMEKQRKTKRKAFLLDCVPLCQLPKKNPIKNIHIVNPETSFCFNVKIRKRTETNERNYYLRYTHM